MQTQTLKASGFSKPPPAEPACANPEARKCPYPHELLFRSRPALPDAPGV